MVIRSTVVARLLFIVPLLAAGLALGAPSPAAAAVVCGANWPGVQEISGTIKDSVVVKAGTQCRLNGAVVRGGVTIEPGAGGFQAVNGTDIRGSVTASEPWNYFVIADSVVRGSVTVIGGRFLDSINVVNSQVRGDIVLIGNDYNPGVDTFVSGNSVRGSVVLRDNFSSGLLSLHANTIDVNLDCSGNFYVILDGPLNTVGGEATGQCAGLAAQ